MRSAADAYPGTPSEPARVDPEATWAHHDTADLRLLAAGIRLYRHEAGGDAIWLRADAAPRPGHPAGRRSRGAAPAAGGDAAHAGRPALGPAAGRASVGERAARPAAPRRAGPGRGARHGRDARLADCAQ